MDEKIIWIAVNKNGVIVMFIDDEPIKNEKTGKWEGKYFVNSLLYKDICELVKKSNITWDCEAFSLQIKQK